MATRAVNQLVNVSRYLVASVIWVLPALLHDSVHYPEMWLELQGYVWSAEVAGLTAAVSSLTVRSFNVSTAGPIKERQLMQAVVSSFVYVCESCKQLSIC